MELLQKYVKNGGKVGIDNLDRWSSDSLAVGFLSTTTSADSIQTLMEVCPFDPSESHTLTKVCLEHPLISKTNFCKEELIGLAWFALHSTRTFWSYSPSARQ